MKKIYLLVAMCLNIAYMCAETYKAAVVNLKSGESVNYTLEELSIAVKDGKVQVLSTKANASWPLSEVESFEVKEIDSESTSVKEITTFAVFFNSSINTLQINNYTGKVDLFFIGGQLRKSYDVKGSATLNLNELPQSAYVCVFRANGQTLKIVTK